MKTKAMCSIVSMLCLVTAVSASPFVPLRWRTPVKSGPCAGQRKHVGWIRDQNGDFVDDAFDELSRDETTQVVVQLSECLCPEEPNAALGSYGRVVSTGVLAAYVILDDVPVSRLNDLAGEPSVAALERPAEDHDALNVSTRTVRARKSKTYQGQSFSDMGPWDGSGITVAIVDSGIWDEHHAFTGKCAGGYDATLNPPAEGNPDDGNGHGTNVASVAVGLGAVTKPGVLGSGRPSDDGTPSSEDTCQGMAPGASFLDVKVNESETTTVLAGVLYDGLEWVFKNGKADVINISKWGGGASAGGGVAAEVINGLVANGFHVVVCAGNSGSQELGDMAAAELAITVGNADDHWTIDRADDTIDSTSSYGPRLDFDPDKLTIGMLKPDLVAPGMQVCAASYLDDNGYEAVSGTSISAPHVAGAIALLLSMPEGANVSPESMKELLRETAYRPQSFTDYVDPKTGAKVPGYDNKWGAGLLDVYAAAQALKNGVTDVTFPTAASGNPNPQVRPCLLKGGRAFYANDVDIVVSPDPPLVGPNNQITVTVENRATGRNQKTAQNVKVCIGVIDFKVGARRMYNVGCKTISSIAPGATQSVTLAWTARNSEHQCIQASIAYPFDTDFTNNVTQRNVKVQNVEKNSSPSRGVFYVDNPLNEPATITLEIKPDALGRRAYTYELQRDTFFLRPEDCPVLNTITFFPKGPQPAGQTAIFDVAGTAFTKSNEGGVELSGVVFKVVAVDPGLERAYTCASHGPAGMINLPLALSGSPTSDPRREVNRIEVFFNVPVRPVTGVSLNDAVRLGIRSASNNPIPGLQASFADPVDAGTDLTIEFFEPLRNADRYTLDFGYPGGFVDLDGDPLTGDDEFEFQALRGDANNDGTVDLNDISFVRERIGQSVELDGVCRADVNQDGVITSEDIHFIVERLPDTVPSEGVARSGGRWSSEATRPR
jgi:hypothetical protein